MTVVTSEPAPVFVIELLDMSGPPIYVIHMVHVMTTCSFAASWPGEAAAYGGTAHTAAAYGGTATHRPPTAEPLHATDVATSCSLLQVGTVVGLREVWI